jgi:hypothetical protein
MTQAPPPMYGQQPGYGYNPPPSQQANGPAIASLILGILGCVPLITGLLAVLFGVVGLRKTRDPAVGGKGLAIAGLILGLISIFGWCAFGGTMFAAYLASKPPRATAHRFIADLAAGNTQAAVNESTFTSIQITLATSQFQQYGRLVDTSFPAFSINANNGVTTAKLTGVVKFSNGSKACTIDLIKQGKTYKVTNYTFQ